MMRPLKKGDIGVGSVITYFKEEETIYRNEKTGEKIYKKVVQLPAPRTKIITFKINGIEEKDIKKDNSKRLIGYRVAYQDYGNSAVERMGFIPAVEMERILSCARLVRG